MLLLALLAATAAPAAKTSAMDDWHQLTITGVGGDAASPLYLRVQAGDLDGDGVADDAVLKLACSDGKLAGSSYVVAPRDAASGMATGKRQHGAITIVKKWGAASPQLSKIKPQYDIKTLKGNERAADGWTSVTLANTDGLCAASEAAAAAIIKSKSNITNN